MHHWDENGLDDSDARSHTTVPKAVQATQDWEVEFVKAWVEEARVSGLFSGMRKVEGEVDEKAEKVEVEEVVEEEVEEGDVGSSGTSEGQKVLGL